VISRHTWGAGALMILRKWRTFQISLGRRHWVSSNRDGEQSTPLLAITTSKLSFTTFRGQADSGHRIPPDLEFKHVGANYRHIDLFRRRGESALIRTIDLTPLH
jgi:hypothetical protein